MRLVSQPVERIVAFSLQDGIWIEVQQKVYDKATEVKKLLALRSYGKARKN
jgi:hypothetical protein